MTQAEKTSTFQKAIDTVEALSPEEQNILINIIQIGIKLLIALCSRGFNRRMIQGVAEQNS